MSRILLRCARRRTAWEPETESEDRFRAEFCFPDGSTDLAPSVYDVEKSMETVVRVHAEHAAGAELDPPRGSINVDLSGWMRVVDTQGTCRFSFAKQSHRELVFASEAELRTFLDSVVKDLAGRSYGTTKKDLVNYAKSRIQKQDEEWLQFCKESGKGKNWGCSAVR